MDPTLYSRFYSSGQLLCPTGGLGLLPRHPQYALFHQVLPSFTNPDWTNPWLLVQCNQPAAHYLSLGGP